jgi:hypothetical protein
VFLRITTRTVLGLAPLTRRQFNEMRHSNKETRRTPVQHCLSVINCLLIMGRYIPDCNYNHLSIGFFKDEVVEEALEILRTRGGWEARISGRSEEHGVSIELIGDF